MDVIVEQNELSENRNRIPIHEAQKDELFMVKRAKKGSGRCYCIIQSLKPQLFPELIQIVNRNRIPIF